MFIVYKMKKFPINIENFKRNSKFFDKTREFFDEYIMLPEPYGDVLEITDATFGTFLFIVHCNMSEFTEEELGEKCKIDANNVLQLNYLAKTFEVPYLIEKTSEFMHKNQEDVLNIMFKIKPVDWNFQLEKFIVDILHTIIDDKRLLTLSISMLHRIIDKFMEKNGLLYVKDIIDFFFKCLNHYGIDASPLCRQIPISIYEDQFLYTLTNEYKDLFDLDFLSSDHVLYMANKLQRLQAELNSIRSTQ